MSTISARYHGSSRKGETNIRDVELARTTTDAAGSHTTRGAVTSAVTASWATCEVTAVGRTGKSGLCLAVLEGKKIHLSVTTNSGDPC